MGNWTQQQRYLDAALENLHWIGGRNPSSYSMVSGHGAKPSNFYSWYWTNRSHMPPGYLPGGINDDVLAQYGLPGWKSYEDVHIAPIEEPDISWNAQAAWAYGWFASG